MFDLSSSENKCLWSLFWSMRLSFLGPFGYFGREESLYEPVTSMNTTFSIDKDTKLLQLCKCSSNRWFIDKHYYRHLGI